MVHVNNTKPIHASQIRVRFRAEEVATAKVREYGLETKIERIDQVTTTYFDVCTKVWGTEPSGKFRFVCFSLFSGEKKLNMRVTY